MAYVTFPEAQIISELRSSIMDKLHMGGTYLQQASTVTINGLPVAIRQGGLGNLGASLTGALAALGGLQGLLSLATQLSSLSQLANLAQLADIKSLTGALGALGGDLGSLGDLTKNLGDLKDLTGMLGGALDALPDVSVLSGDLQNMISDLGGIEGLKSQISQISDFSDKLGSLNDLASSVSSAATETLTGSSSFLKNPVSDLVGSISTLKGETENAFSDIFSKLDTVASATDNPYIAYTIQSSFWDLDTNIGKLQDHTDTLSGLKEKGIFLMPELGDPTYYNDINDLIRLGGQLENSLGVTTDTVLSSAASALQSENTYNQITDSLNIDVKNAIQTINNLTPDGGANDSIIMATASRIYDNLNNHNNTIYDIVDGDLQNAQTYDSRVTAINRITKVTSMVNTDGFSKLKGWVVKPEYSDLINYK